MPSGPLKDQIPYHLISLVRHLLPGVISLALIFTYDAIRWPWDLMVIVNHTVCHLCLATKSLAITLLWLLVFGSAAIISVLPALALITIYEALCLCERLWKHGTFASTLTSVWFSANAN